MTLCGMVHLWRRRLLYCQSLCDVIMYLKAIVFWMSGDDDHSVWRICLVFHSSYDLRCVANVISMWVTMLGLGLDASIDDLYLLMTTLPMYPYMKVWLANVKILECKSWSCVVSYAKMCCMVYAWMCIVVLRRWLPQCVVDRHYVIMLTYIHKLRLHAYL